MLINVNNYSTKKDHHCVQITIGDISIYYSGRMPAAYKIRKDLVRLDDKYLGPIGKKHMSYIVCNGHEHRVAQEELNTSLNNMLKEVFMITAQQIISGSLESK